MQDFLTDLNAEYEPFLSGFAHRGVLRTTKWIEEHHFDDLFRYMSESGCANLYIVGHSLGMLPFLTSGGAIAVLLVMIIKSQYWARFSSLPKFKMLHTYTFGAPPCVSQSLAEEYKKYASGYIFESDLVPRISYGSLLDFRELIICANRAIKSRAGEREKMKVVDARRRELVGSPLHPKAVHCGSLYFIYKTSRVPKRAGLDDDVDIEDEDGRSKHYVVEESHAENFLNLHVRLNLAYHHFPSSYKKGIEQSIAYMKEN
jgi:hypothetical protein